MAKKEITDNVERDIEFVDTKNEILARCDAEQRENYNVIKSWSFGKI